jgi:hypothetical protein
MFEGFALCLQIGLSIVVGGIQLRMTQPASNDGDIHARCDEMDGGRVPAIPAPE